MSVFATQFLFAIWLLPASLVAQVGVIVSGTVEDESRAVILGAQVRLASGEPPRTTSSDEQGRFRFEGVTPGKYKLRAEAAGFEPQELEIMAGMESPGPLTLKLKVSALAAQVTVEDPLEESTEPDSNADALKLDDDFFRMLPIPTEDVMPLVTKLSSPAAQGAEGLSIVVDGMEGNRLDVPASAISSVRINKNPYSAEFQRPGKGTVQVRTERGSKRSYHGSFATFARNSLFDARNAFAQSTPDLDRRFVSASFGGPLGARSRRFFLSGENLTNNESAVVNAITPAGPFFANVPSPQRRGRFLARYDWRPGNAHAVSVSYGFSNDSKKNQSVKGFNLPEQGVSEQERQDRFQLSYGAIISGNLINDLRFALRKEGESSGQPAAARTVVVEGAFTGGPSPTFRKDVKKGFEAQDAVTYVHGGQTIRFGAESRTRITDVSDASNFNGTFQFGSLQDFVAGTPFVFRVNRGQEAVGFTVWEVGGFAQDELRLNRQLSLVFGLRYDWQSSINDRTNFAPRFTLAFAPGKQKTVLRGGAGVFYESLPSRVTERSLLFDGIRFQQVVIPKPLFPDPFPGGQLIVPPPSVIRVSPEIRFPYLLQTSISVERELGPWTWLSVDYSYFRGVHLFRSRDINAPLPTIGLRPNPGFSNINQVESSASLRSNALSVTFRGRAGKFFKGTAQYTLSRSTNDTAGPFFLPADNFKLGPEWGRADFDQRHRFNFGGFLELPGEFRLGSIFSTASGAPFNITTGFDNNGDTTGNDRPSGINRNTGRGPASVQLDVRLTKTFKLAPPFHGDEPLTKHELHNLEFSVDAFNAINHTNLANIVGTQSSPFFGRANSASPARTIQLSVKYLF